MATADALLSQVLARCFWPGSNAPLTSAEILSFADAEIAGSIWPDLLAAQGDYYVSTQDHTITADYARYRLPKRAYGPIKDVLLVDDDDNETSLGLINLEELGHYPTTTGKCKHFIDGDFLGLYPTPSATEGTLRVRYYRHPSTLCLTTAAREIVISVDLAGGVLGAAAASTLWTGASVVDVIGAGNAHQVLAEDLGVDAAGAFSVTVEADLTGSGIQVGDWIATTGTTPLVQVPDSMIPLLAYRTALACLSAAGDRSGFALCLEWGAQSGLEEKQRKLLEPRTESEPRSITTRHSTLWLGRGRVRSWQ